MLMEPMGKESAGSSTPLILSSGASGRVNALISRRALRTLLVLLNAFELLLLAPFGGRGRSISTTPSIEASEKPKGGKQESSGSHRRASMVRIPVTIVPLRNTVTADQDATTRRAIAIRRVVHDKDEATIKKFSLFSTCRGETLFTQTWTPVSIQIRGVVIILHGLNEHSGRYNDFAKVLNGSGYKVYGMDWIGHGGSDGLHAYVHSLDYAVSDMKAFVQNVVAENPGLPCFCFGHSTGAAIVLKAALDPKVEASVAGIIITSPAIGMQLSHPIFAVLAPVLSLVLPRYQVSAANKNGTAVARDTAALHAKYSDPLVYTGAIRVRTGCEILRLSSHLRGRLSGVRVPFLVLHGTADGLTDPGGSRRLYEAATSADKSLKLYEGLLHDLLIEPERDEVMRDIVEWVDGRSVRPSPSQGER